jgi:peptidyl-prolyl cis-trans isomerase-like protein 2
MERIEVDKYDAPIEDIIFLKADVFVDPYEEVDEELAEARRLEAEKLRKEKEELAAKKVQSKPKELKVYREGVGKYLAKASTKTSSGVEPPSKKSKSSYSFNFNNW